MVKKRSFGLTELPTGTPVKISGCKSLKKTEYFKVTYGTTSGYVPRDLFVSQKSEARTVLQKQGVVITSNKDWNAIGELIEGVRLFKRRPLIEGPGWTGPYFADKGGEVFSPAGAPKGIAIFEPNGSGASYKGTLKAWRREVAVPLAGQTIPMIAVLAAFASPFLRLVGDPYNFGFEFCGPPATGKTSCLAIMASVAGNPAHISNFNATIAGFEAMFVEHQDLPFPIDEANLVDGRNLTFFKEFAFRLANGSVKVTAFQPDRAYYRFIFATTANQPFPETLKGFDMDTAGAALQRLFPLKIPNENELGVFDFLPEGFAHSGALASHLQEAICSQYGTAMQRFLQCLVDAHAAGAAGVREMIDRHIREFEAAVGIAGTVRGKSRASSAFGLLYAAGSFAKEMDILPEQWDCLVACIAGYRNYQAQLPEQTPLITRLLTIAKRPLTIDLRGIDLPALGNGEVAHHGAFLRHGTKGRLELLITVDLQEASFPDWARLEHSADFKRYNRRDPDHITKQRQVRQGRKKERFVLFVLPSELGL